MIAQLPKMVVFNVTLVLFFGSILAPSPRATASEALVEFGTNLAKRRDIIIKVQAIDGKPLSGVTVVCVGPTTNAMLKGTTVEGGGERFQTDAEGRFSLPLSDPDLVVVLATVQGFGLAQSRDLTNNPTMVIPPWGRIEGVRTNRNRPLANARLGWKFNWRCVGPDIRDRVVTRDETATDSQGRFTLEHVPPTEIELWELHQSQRKENQTDLSLHLQYLEVEPGETKRVMLVTAGRTVVGRLELSGNLDSTLDLASCFAGLDPLMPGRRFILPDVPKEFDLPEKRIKWWHNFWFNTDAGELMKNVPSFFDVQRDGSFRAEMVAPRTYRLWGSIDTNNKTVARVDEVSIVIPEAETGADDAPFDLGQITLKPVVDLKIGDVAPDFSIKTLDDWPLKLSDFRGKYVLLDFWATWCGPCVAELPNLKAVHDAFGKDARFTLVSLSLDSDREEPKKFVRAKGIRWTQAFLGEWSKDTVTQRYGVYGIPQIFLVGPDGKIMARSLRGPKIKEAVTAALGH